MATPRNIQHHRGVGSRSEHLRELGGDRVQGFAIAPAMAPDELGRWLAQRKRVPAVGSGRVQLIADERLFDPAVQRSTAGVSATSTDHHSSPGPLRSLRRAAAPHSAPRTVLTPAVAPALTLTSALSLTPTPRELATPTPRQLATATDEDPSGSTRFLLGPDVRFAPPVLDTVTAAALGEVDGSDDPMTWVLSDPVPGIVSDPVSVAPSVPFAMGTTELPPDWRSLLRSP